MTDGVDADVDSVKAGTLEAAADRASADAQPTELPDGDNAMLVGGQLSQRALALWPGGWLTWSTYMAREVSHPGHSAELALEMRPDGRTNVTKA
jgi:hypothetical protein